MNHPLCVDFVGGYSLTSGIAIAFLTDFGCFIIKHLILFPGTVFSVFSCPFYGIFYFFYPRHLIYLLCLFTLPSPPHNARREFSIGSNIQSYPLGIPTSGSPDPGGLEAAPGAGAGSGLPRGGGKVPLRPGRQPDPQTVREGALIGRTEIPIGSKWSSLRM